jgi:hypothetical protein
MKMQPVLLAFGFLFVACTLNSPISTPVGDITAQASLTQPTIPIDSQVAQQNVQNVSGVKWSEVAFDDIAPRNMNLKECWNAMGIDGQGRIYIGFTSARADGRDDFNVFRYDPRNSERKYLGSFLDITASAGNSQAGEEIPKGHTRMVFANGQMYMGSQGFHDLKAEIDSLPTYRGSHLYALNTSNDLWKDLSASMPGGVVTQHEGIISLNIMPKDNLLVGLAHPSSDIVLYNYLTEQLVKVMPGIPWKLGNPLSRESIVTPGGNIYTYRGTEAVDQRHEVHSVWVHNIHTGEVRDTGFQMTNGFWIGQTAKRDGSKTYVSTIGGQLYEFDVATETFKDLGHALPENDNRIIDFTYALTLSPDETRLYYILSVIRKPGGGVGNGSGGSGELYYYDLATGQVVFIQQLPVGIYTSADVRDTQNIYFAHFGDSTNLWSGNPKLFILNVPPTTMSKIDLHANIETVGVTVSGANLSKTAELMYRRASETTWHTGHPLMRIDDGRQVGSLFGLTPSTSYEIKVVDGAASISGSVTTQPNELQFAPSTVIHVDDDAPPGGDGSAAAPYRTIQEGVNRASPGSQVLVTDGIYRETVTFPASGTDGSWIQVKAAGSGAVLDGSETLSGNIWKEHDKNRVWFTRISGPISYLARDQKRFYNFDDLAGLLQRRGHGNEPMNEGWFYERSTNKLYVRSMNDPSRHTWQVPYLNRAFDVTNQDWLWIEGFEMRFYGTQLDGCGVCTTNASHVVIRKNRIHNIQLGIYINWNGNEQQGNDTRIEYNEIYDPPVNEWPWKAVKGSSMEGTAIVLRGHIGAIVRGNELHNFFNGIFTGASGTLESPELAFDADVYNNNIQHISDDALEPEGASVNQRFRNNTIDTSFVGLSLSPITQGPVWVLRSSFANYTGRGIKFDGDSDGIALIYHNTFWTAAQDTPAMDFIRPAHNVSLRNNIFQGNGYGIYEVRTGSSGHDWNYNNWYTARTPRFLWENVNYPNLAGFCASTGLECNGHEAPPGLSNPGSRNFMLLPSSPNLDRGVLIPGINDGFTGSAPDIGAFEYANAVDLPPSVTSILRANANPTNAPGVNFTVTFSEPVTGVDILPPFNDFRLSTTPGIADASITGVTPVSGTTYTVSVNTGSGSGELHLQLVDDNSIVDMTNNPLGGPNTGDGNFNSGESYTMDKNAPSVTSSLRADLDPTRADNVNFSVTFTETVTGVDTSDFTLTTTGTVNGAYVANVNGSGNTYTVTVFTGNGDGGLRLDVLDDDSVVNASGVPLAGAGAGNGAFTSGEAYTIDKIAPLVTGSLRVDADPTSADSVSFTVVFSEAVSGVDGSDFSLSTSGNISGASITAINGSGYLYTVTVNTGNGDGTLRLDILDNDSIFDVAVQPLGGSGPGNGNFNTGEEYTIQKISAPTVTEVFRSNGSYDGWVLESRETSNRGGSRNNRANSFILGDDKGNRQYRAILDFSTDTLPDNAVITKVLLMIQGRGLVGTNPFETHQNIQVDIRSGTFSAFGPIPFRGLQNSDFQASSSRDAVGFIQNNPYYGWYWTWLDNSAFQYINVYGSTQFRLHFQVDDNNDRGNDFLRFHSGDSGDISEQPQLVIEYYVP